MNKVELEALSPRELRSLREKFAAIQGDCTWKTEEEFASWSIDHGWKFGMDLYKISAGRPYGPDNSFWYLQHKEVPESECTFCAGCDLKLSVCHTIGCLKYREWFVKNWNENICRRPNPRAPSKRETFRYEHPDMVREGIVFEHVT